MIVDKMSYEQIARELDRVRERAITWVDHNEKAVFRRLRNSPSRAIHIPIPQGAKNPNCIIVCALRGKLEVESYLVWRETDHGKYFYTMHELDGMYLYVEFTPHFTARYIERLGLDCTATEAMIRYVKTTMINGITEMETGNAPTLKLNKEAEGRIIYIKMEDGIVVGDRVNNFLLVKTFLTDDMGLDPEKPVIANLELSYLLRDNSTTNTVHPQPRGYQKMERGDYVFYRLPQKKGKKK